MITVTGADIRRQLKADLIGKDSYRGVTLTYAWMANQLGHFSLGFVPTLLIYLFLRDRPSVAHPARLAGIIVGGAWLLFELYNFLGPLLFNKTSKSKLVYAPSKRYRFQPSWANIAFDTITDVGFFCVGAGAAAYYLQPDKATGIVVLAILAALAIPSRYWYLTRIYLQTAGYPMQFRLSQWEAEISDADLATVLRFLAHPGTGKHLLVFGPKNSGKTTIAIGMATELSNKHRPCMYTTAMKLYTLFFDAPKDGPLWDWRSAAVLVIDDINPGDPITDELVSASAFLRFLDASAVPNEVNRTCLKDKNVIWVLGNKSSSLPVPEWENLLEKIGVARTDVSSINLLQP